MTTRQYGDEPLSFSEAASANPKHGSLLDQPVVREIIAERDDARTKYTKLLGQFEASVAEIKAWKDEADRSHDVALHNWKIANGYQDERDKAQRELAAARAVIDSLAPTEAGQWKAAWEQMRDVAGTLEHERDAARRALDLALAQCNDQVVEMPTEGDWFPVADRLRQTCCGCGAVHVWSFRQRGGAIEVAIDTSSNLARPWIDRVDSDDLQRQLADALKTIDLLRAGIRRVLDKAQEGV